MSVERSQKDIPQPRKEGTHQEIEINSERLIKSFMEMVQIDSESGEEKPFAEYLTSLATGMELKNWTDDHMNVYVEVPGTGEPLMLNTHMDTVKPGKGIKPRIDGEYITSDGTTILGADSKAGIAAMFEVVQILKEQNLQHRPLVLTFSCNEETGIPTAQHITSDVKECIVPDRSTPLGEYITEAPFAQVYSVHVKGKAAYATTSFDKGVHAIRSATEMIHNLPLGNIDENTTTNIGIIDGGLMTSMIPEFCSFKGNCYSFSETSFKNFLKTLGVEVEKVDALYGTNSTIEMLEYFPGFRLEKDDPLISLVDRAMRDVGISPKHEKHKAVTNANLLNSVGIRSILISDGVENQHTVNERIKKSTLVNLTKILLASVRN